MRTFISFFLVITVFLAACGPDFTQGQNDADAGDELPRFYPEPAPRADIQEERDVASAEDLTNSDFRQAMPLDIDGEPDTAQETEVQDLEEPDAPDPFFFTCDVWKVLQFTNNDPQRILDLQWVYQSGESDKHFIHPGQSASLEVCAEFESWMKFNDSNGGFNVTIGTGDGTAFIMQSWNGDLIYDSQATTSSINFDTRGGSLYQIRFPEILLSTESGTICDNDQSITLSNFTQADTLSVLVLFRDVFQEYFIVSQGSEEIPSCHHEDVYLYASAGTSVNIRNLRNKEFQVTCWIHPGIEQTVQNFHGGLPVPQISAEYARIAAPVDCFPEDPEKHAFTTQTSPTDFSIVYISPPPGSNWVVEIHEQARPPHEVYRNIF